MPSLVTSHSRFELSFLCDQSAKIWVYDQLSLRRTPLGQALSVLRRENSVRLIEYQLRKQKKGRDQLWVSVRESRL